MTDTASNASAIGVDIGTSRIVAAFQTDQGFRFESQLNAFVNLPYSKMTETALRKEQVAHTVENFDILVHGSAAERFADLSNGEIRRPMLRGLLNSGEPESVRMIAAITGMLAGRGAQPGQKICFTVPAAPAGAEENLPYHKATLKQVFRDLGYEAETVNEGLAVVYSELESTNYTGIGISCGGGLCNVCFSYLSVPVITFSIPKAGDFIDASAAAVAAERTNRVRMVKEDSFVLNGHFPSQLHQVLTVYYEDMMRSLVAALKDAFTNARSVPKLGRPIPLVLSGGTALPQGFRDRFEKILRESNFPVPLSEIRMAADPLTATARGAAIAALSERGA